MHGLRHLPLHLELAVVEGIGNVLTKFPLAILGQTDRARAGV